METARAIRERWLPIHLEVEKENDEEREKNKTVPAGYKSGPYDYLIHLSEKLFQQLESWYELTHKFRCCYYAKVLLSGEAGIGKSHALAAIPISYRLEIQQG